ncbi:reverse transcriptase domain-containing protein [Tanacetum coccineum]
MPPRMMTRSEGRSTAAPRGGGTGGRVAQVGNQVSNQGNGRNQNDDAVNDNIQGDVRNVIVNNHRRGCTYKEFLACNPKEYDGKGGDIVYTRWIEKMESVQYMSGCGDNQKVKYTARTFVGKALTWWNSQIHTRSREAAVGMLWEDFKTLKIEEFYPINKMQKLETKFWNHAMVEAGHAAYTDRFHELARLVPHFITPENKRIESEAIRNGPHKKNTEKKGNGGEPSRDRNVKDDNKRSKTGNAFATTVNPFNRLRHLAKDCRVVPRMVNLVNARNPTTTRGACFECGGTDHFKVACPRNNDNRARGGVFMLGAEEARQDPNIMTGIESSNLGFSYEIEIASGQLVEIDKVIRGCELEIEGYTFNIDLIPFGSRSFEVIVGMDWLSKHKAKIICHEKVVRIPLRNGKTLRVIGERPEEKVRHLRSAKTKEQRRRILSWLETFPRTRVSLFLITGSLVLLAPLPTHPPIPPSCGATVDQPALRVFILGGIIYTRENMGSIVRVKGLASIGIQVCSFGFYRSHTQRCKTHGATTSSTGAQMGKNPSRSFRPVKSAEILWQFWASSSFGVSLAHDGSWAR